MQTFYSSFKFSLENFMPSQRIAFQKKEDILCKIWFFALQFQWIKDFNILNARNNLNSNLFQEQAERFKKKVKVSLATCKTRQDTNRNKINIKYN